MLIFKRTRRENKPAINHKIPVLLKQQDLSSGAKVSHWVNTFTQQSLPDCHFMLIIGESRISETGSVCLITIVENKGWREILCG